MSRPKLVLLGNLSRIPVGGVIWLHAQYAIGFERLGYDVYYIEAHSSTPNVFMSEPDDDATALAAAFLNETWKRFGMEHKWAFHALHGDGRFEGMSEGEVRRLYRDAAAIINLHGATIPLDEHAENGRLVYLGTDVVEVELEVAQRDQHCLDYLDRHSAHFNWGTNYGNPDCLLPWSSEYRFVPTGPLVVPDLWDVDAPPPGAPFTTIGNWRQHARTVTFEGKKLAWSKHQQFDIVLDVPKRVDAPFEMALASYEHDDQAMLESHGWRILDGFEPSRSADWYRSYVMGSAGEFTVAKEQNVYFRSGWFSERSAAYLASGRPVIVQDTGIGNALPTGLGLLTFHDEDSACDAVERVVAEPERHRLAARAIATEFLGYEFVLGSMLDHLGLPHGPTRRRTPFPVAEFPDGDTLDEAQRTELLARAIPSAPAPDGAPEFSVVVVADGHDLALTRRTIESILVSIAGPPYEFIVVVDDASPTAVRHYVEALAVRNRQVVVQRNAEPGGHDRAVDRGLDAASAAAVVLVDIGWVGRPGLIEALVAPGGRVGVDGSDARVRAIREQLPSVAVTDRERGAVTEVQSRPGRRLVVVNADDFGASDGVNAGIIRAHEDGIVTSASLMVHGPAADGAADYAWDGALSVGLHFDVAEWVYRNGEWEARYEIVDPSDEVAIRRELDKQLAMFEELVGRPPSHIDSHQHVHQHDPVRSAVTWAGAQLRVPVRHADGNGINYVGDFYGQGPKGDPFHEAITPEWLVSVLDALGDGVFEIACHPAAAVEYDTAYRDERMIELTTLCDPSVRDAIERNAITLCSFTELAEHRA